MSDSAANIITVENLGVTFDTRRGPVVALRGVSFALAQGEILGVVGESGSGKSVACSSILRLLPKNARVTSGDVRIGGERVLELPERDLLKLRGGRVAMIFQNPSTHLDPLMSVGKQIGEAVRVHFGASEKEARGRAIDLLRRVRIAEPERRVDAYPHELSGGMKQRVMIAAALACEPEVLIADEPTTALDVTVQASILGLLKTLRDEAGLSVIMVSHDLGVIATMCDRIVVMKDGGVVETGSREAILFAPGAAYTKELIAAHPEVGWGPEPVEESVTEAGAVEAGIIEAGGVIGAEAAEEPALLELEHLCVHFGQEGFWTFASFGREPVKAVDGVSLSLRRGDILGLVGESGSGKSTVARALVGLVAPTAGGVRYRGEPLADLRGDARLAYRRAVQMVFQDPFTSLNPRLSVAQTLAEPLRKHRICPPGDLKAQVQALMEAVELPAAFLHRRPHQLSGGQRQRVGVARALAVEPEVLIADEVTSALDVTIQAQILALLERLQKEMGLTILFISHDLGVVQRLCRNVAVMREGRLVEVGPTSRILSHPQQRYTQELLAAVPRLVPGPRAAREEGAAHAKTARDVGETPRQL